MLDSPSEGLRWENPHYYLANELFYPKIFEAASLEEAVPTGFNSVPTGFNSVSIALDGRLKSSLDWKEARQAAKKFTTQGLKIFWMLDLGLSKLDFPMANETQFHALRLCLEHFRETLWTEFREDTIGLSLGCFNLDFSSNFLWDEIQLSNWQDWLKNHFEVIENLNVKFMGNKKPFQDFSSCLPETIDLKSLVQLYCRDVVSEFVQLLTDGLPDPLQLYLLLDAPQSIDPLQSALLASSERFGRVLIAIKEDSFAIKQFAWGTGTYTSGFIGRRPIDQAVDLPTVAICLPSTDIMTTEAFQKLHEAFQLLIQKQIPFRVIPENLLIHQWDGLDDLIFEPSMMSFQGKRNLQGFCAAGGRVITADFLVGLPNEISLNTVVK
jgi:hypothetical protein